MTNILYYITNIFKTKEPPINCKKHRKYKQCKIHNKQLYGCLDCKHFIIENYLKSGY